MASDPVRLQGPDAELRPFGRFLSDLWPPLRRCLLALLVVAALGWLPATVALAAALLAGIDLEAIVSLLEPERLVTLLDGSEPVPALTTGSTRTLAIWLAAAGGLYLAGQAFVSAGSGFLLAAATTDRPAGMVAALRWAARRMPRALLALLVVVGVVGSPLAVLIVAILLGLPWSVVPVAVLVALAATLVLTGRFSLAGTTAALAPEGVPVLRTALGAVSGRWMQVLVRVLAVSLVVSAAASLVSAPLLAAGVAAGPAVLAAAFAVRVVLSLASTALALSSTVLVYQDLGLPVDGRLEPSPADPAH